MRARSRRAGSTDRGPTAVARRLTRARSRQVGSHDCRPDRRVVRRLMRARSRQAGSHDCRPDREVARRPTRAQQASRQSRLPARPRGRTSIDAGAVESLQHGAGPTLGRSRLAPGAAERLQPVAGPTAGRVASIGAGRGGAPAARWRPDCPVARRLAPVRRRPAVTLAGTAGSHVDCCRRDDALASSPGIAGAVRKPKAATKLACPATNRDVAAARRNEQCSRSDPGGLSNAPGCVGRVRSGGFRRPKARAERWPRMLIQT
jgi:hypothetical protein